jgi:hypothetical protein
MAGRSELQKSAAYWALSNGGRKVLHAVEQQAGRGAVAITFEQLMEESGLCRSSVRYGVKQAQLLGFIAVSMGPRRTNEFKLTDGWRGLSADEAKRRVAQARLPTPSRESSAPPRAVRQSSGGPRCRSRSSSHPRRVSRQCQWCNGLVTGDSGTLPALRPSAS